MWAAFLAPRPKVLLRREVWSTPDGDRIAVDCLDAPPEAPVVTLFHGLESSSSGHYAAPLAALLRARGWRGYWINFRGCGGMDNLLPRAYHAGDSAEIAWILARIARQDPAVPRFAVGVSLGGNALLKYLGEAGHDARAILRGAAAVCAPVNLVATAAALEQGLGILYSRYFLRQLKRSARRYRRLHRGMADWNKVLAATDLHSFDECFTAPVHGFSGADGYWQQASAAPWLQSILVPTLLLNSEDDPIVPISAIRAASLSPAITPCFPAHGGHVGFVDGPFPGRLQWLPHALLAYFESIIQP
ncbi:MAG: YheT family hydrolase [Acidithiobacillus sp.]|uniref:YheT family hydrolase n=1 Tax=Acidithiobacillus sp. TaxID=1872118 RepID=UPI003CFD6F56